MMRKVRFQLPNTTSSKAGSTPDTRFKNGVVRKSSGNRQERAFYEYKRAVEQYINNPGNQDIPEDLGNKTPTSLQHIIALVQLKKIEVQLQIRNLEEEIQKEAQDSRNQEPTLQQYELELQHYQQRDPGNPMIQMLQDEINQLKGGSALGNKVVDPRKKKMADLEQVVADYDNQIHALRAILDEEPSEEKIEELENSIYSLRETLKNLLKNPDVIKEDPEILKSLTQSLSIEQNKLDALIKKMSSARISDLQDKLKNSGQGVETIIR